MKNMKRILVTMVAAVLLMAVTVAGTLAYLTAQTNTVKNTFATGNVSFDEDMNNGLDEGDVWEAGETTPDGDAPTADELGQHKGDDYPRVTENNYKLVPSKTYDKDPTVYIKAGSEPCYVFVEVVNGMKPYLVEENIENQMKAKWTNIAGTNIWYYNEVVDALNIEEDNIPLVVFKTITLRGDLDETQLALAATQTIEIKAYAVQAAGLADATTAWNATFGAPTQGN